MVRINVLNDTLEHVQCGEAREETSDDQTLLKSDIQISPGYAKVTLENFSMSMKIVVELNGRLNECGVISPRFDMGVKDFEPWTPRLLPSRQFGYIVLTTSAGVMDQEEGRRGETNVGGKVLSFFYLG